MTSAARRGMVGFAVGLALLAGALAYFYARSGGGFGTEQVAALEIGGSFVLTDQNGELRRSEEFRGKLMLVYFGYTFCPDACPTALQDMSAALDLLGDKASSVQPIFSTIDPERDTVAQMRLYASNFHPRLIALTGSPQAIAAAARAYRVYYQKQTGGNADEYLMDHSGLIYLMGRDGRYLAHFSPGITPAEMAAAISSHL
jgi:cytochrome oxidase Cu insertion factor (SCO1/SenC/PrrC family)